MNQETTPVSIETDLFVFNAPIGFQIQSLEEDAELVGPNDEFLVVSSYSLNDDCSDQDISDFANNISNAMGEAVNEPDLQVTDKLCKVVADNGLPIWSLLSQATDQSHFFDQYAVIQGANAIVVTVEGNFEDRTTSAEVEEAVHGLDFK